MKNIHVLKTDKPSKLQLFEGINEFEFELCSKDSFFNKGTHIYITSDEEIKEGDWFITTDSKEIHKSDWIKFNFDNGKKIILTTDQDLIKDGIQSIDNEFLEWFVKNPSCDEIKVEGHIYKGQDETEYKIIIPKEEHYERTTQSISLSEVDKEELKDKEFQQNLVNKLRSEELTYENASIYTIILDLVQGNGKEEVLRIFNEVIMEEPKQQMYSEEDMKKMYDFGSIGHFTENESLEQFKKK